MQCSAILWNAVQCSEVQRGAVQCSAVQLRLVHCHHDISDLLYIMMMGMCQWASRCCGLSALQKREEYLQAVEEAQAIQQIASKSELDLLTSGAVKTVMNTGHTENQREVKDTLVQCGVCVCQSVSLACVLVNNPLQGFNFKSMTYCKHCHCMVRVMQAVTTE